MAIGSFVGIFLSGEIVTSEVTIITINGIVLIGSGAVLSVLFRRATLPASQKAQ